MDPVVENKVAIILARGGSKRIPRKNIIDFAGKPMLVWSIEAAILSGCFEDVVVSTDDEEIASDCKNAWSTGSFFQERSLDDHATSK